MKEKNSSDSSKQKDLEDQDGNKNTMDHELKAFEGIISAEQNVEYEEDQLLSSFTDKDDRQKRTPKKTMRLAVHPDPHEDNVYTVPLRINLPGGGTADYRLEISINLSEVKKSENVAKDARHSFLDVDDEEGAEIDILDGRTTMMFNADHDADEEDESNEELREDEPKGWMSRFFFWRK